MHMSGDDVRRYIAPPPVTRDRFATFLRWGRTQRRRGRYLTFGIVPQGATQAVGIFQIWPIEPDFSTIEWGIAIGPTYWGTGLAMAAAALGFEFAFRTLDAARLEARACVSNERGTGLLRKLSATPEGVLRDAFRDGDRVEDHRLWSILRREWKTATTAEERI